MWRRKFRSLYEKIEFILSTFLSRIYSRPTCADTFEKVEGRKRVKEERERRKARIVEGEGAADELIFIYANGIGGSS